MNFLAIDTSNRYLCAVAVKDGKAFSAFLPDCAMRHSVTLMTEIDALLKRAGLELSECDFFSAVVGAGSFTGIRIGISAAKGFALAFQKPTLPVTSFDVIAYNALGGETKKKLCLIDALHGYYYACGYDGESVLLEPSYLTETEVLELAKTGYSLYAAEPLPVGKIVPVCVVDPKDGLLNVVMKKGGKKENFGALTALYIRKSSAELNLEEKKGE